MQYCQAHTCTLGNAASSSDSADVVMRRVYGALLVALLVVCCVCAESGRIAMPGWLHGVFVGEWLFVHCVASPFHSFVTTSSYLLSWTRRASMHMSKRPNSWVILSYLTLHLSSCNTFA